MHRLVPTSLLALAALGLPAMALAGGAGPNDLSVRVDPQHWPGWNGVGVNMLNSWLQGGRKDSAQAEQAMAAFRKSLQINPEQVKVQKLLQTYKVGP